MSSFISRSRVVSLALLCLASVSLAPTGQSGALTLDEALLMSRQSLPAYKAAEFRVRSSEQLYEATLGPYIPSIDASTSQQRWYTSAQEFPTWAYDITASYTLYDGGKRRASRDIANYSLDSDRETLRTSLLDLEFNVKTAFYSVIAQKENLAQRTLQLGDSQKDFEVAEGRYKFGVARLSDVLQASVRLEQARFNVIQTEGSLRKAFSDLNSLLGKSLDAHDELQGSLDPEDVLPGREIYMDAAVLRPEIKQAENALKISESNRQLNVSAFLPLVSANATYQSTSGGVGGLATGAGAINEAKILGLTASWNLFELGKFFRYKSSVLENKVSSELINETKRKVRLDVSKAYDDVLTAVGQLKVAQEQFRQAEQNYSQAFGEYKVGKGDILSLVQAESLLANAREQLVGSRLAVALARVQLDRVAGLSRFDSLPR